MPVNFVPDPEFVWDPETRVLYLPPALKPSGAVQAPAPSDTPASAASATDDLVAAVRRLRRAFRRLQEEAGPQWNINVANCWLAYVGDDPDRTVIDVSVWCDGARLPHEEEPRPTGRARAPLSVPRAAARWGYFGRSDVCLFRELLGDNLTRIPGLRRLCLALRHCRRLAARIDPTDRTQTVFASLVASLFRDRWPAGPLEPVGDGREYRAEVTYPAALLDCLDEWAERAPNRCGPKPKPERVAIVRRLIELRAEKRRWKDEIRPTINAEFGTDYEVSSLLDMYKKREAICGVN